ncbi:hypothetical protein [Ruegeria sp. ANG-S4]|uniref:hypothetical protein n=1 Tax=Ruegeria sp. ANG-S4 TaxID=1577904 RepID=UPI001269A5A8|nr:hypothetical protein [Ruegeria sp. ANG-S4]
MTFSETFRIKGQWIGSGPSQIMGLIGPARETPCVRITLGSARDVDTMITNASCVFPVRSGSSLTIGQSAGTRPMGRTPTDRKGGLRNTRNLTLPHGLALNETTHQNMQEKENVKK